MPNETIITRAARVIRNGDGPFRPRNVVHRPLLTRPEFYRVVVPLSLLATSCVPHGDGTPIAMETPRPLSQLVTEQIQAGIPFQPYNSGESRKNDAFIQQQSATYGEFKGSSVMIGIDADNSMINSEMFAFDKGVFVVFYDRDGKAVSDMSPVSLNYGEDINNHNLSLTYKADIGNGEGGKNVVPFLTLFSNTTTDMLDPDVLSAAKSGDPEALSKLAEYFNDPSEIIALRYENPETKQAINLEKKSTPKWQETIKNIVSSLNPFAVTPVHAAPASTATAEATATVPPTPTAKTETIEGKSYTIDGYEARDSAGVLQYIQDTEGKWIKAPPEVAIPVDTGLETRLGTDFSLNADGTGITGIEGLTIDKENGTATFNFDGKGEETFSTSDIHVATKDINGQPMEPKLLMAGYAWNPEAGKWEIYNPGFPMDTAPKDELGWFNKADIANGNWLRWHQRATANVDMDALFKNAMVPDGWYAQDTLINDRDMNEDGIKDVIHTRKLVWTSGTYNSSLRADQKEIIKKDQFPWRGGLSFSFLADSDCVIISLDVQNGDRSKTSMPTVLDSVLWTNYRDKGIFTRAALANGHEWDSSMAETGPFNDTEGWVFGLVINSLPDATITNSMGVNDLAITKEPVAAQRREETIVGSIIAPSAGLEIWGSAILGNYHE